MALTIRMRIDDNDEHQYYYATGSGTEIELIPLVVDANGVFTPDEGKAYNRVTVNVPATELETLIVNANGTYNAPDGKAYDVVKVDVQSIINLQNKSASYTANGNYTIQADSGYDGLDTVSVAVNVPTPSPDLQSKSELYTSNGTYTVTPDSGYDGLSEVEVDVNVPTSNIQPYKEVTLTENGYVNVTPDSGYDAIGAVGVIASVQGSNFIEGTFVMQEGTNNIPDVYIPSGSKIAHVSVVLDNFARISAQTIQRLCVAQEIYLAPNTASPYGYNAYLTRYGASGVSLSAGTQPITASTGDIAISNERFVGLYNNRREVRVHGTTLGTEYGGIVGETYRYYIVLE